jgi:hypothetical protein
MKWNFKVMVLKINLAEHDDLTKADSLEMLLKNGLINRRMLAAITLAFVESYGLDETPEVIVLDDLSKLSRRSLLRQPNFGISSVEYIEKLCATVGVHLLDQKANPPQ